MGRFVSWVSPGSTALCSCQRISRRDVPLQSPRFIIAPAAVGCKRMVDRSLS